MSIKSKINGTERKIPGRFYQLSEGVANAGHPRFNPDGSATDEEAIQNAVDTAEDEGIPIVEVPEEMWPYNKGGVSVPASVSVIREGDAVRIGESLLPSGTPSPGDILRSTGTQWEHAQAEGVAGFPAVPVTFGARFSDTPFTDNDNDPVVVHRRHFDDDEYRVMIHRFDGSDEHRLYRTPDFSPGSYTLITSDAFPGEPVAGNDTFQAAVVRSDGTLLMYQNDGSEGTTAVWKGAPSDLDNASMTKVGRVISTEGDCGVYYEAGAGTIHIYTEDADTKVGVGSSKLSHWTTPDDDLLNATKQADAFDVTDRVWKTGDPDVIKVGNFYYLFTDRTREDLGGHPDYNIAVARGETLDSFTLINSALTAERLGGDMTLVERDGIYEGLTEYDAGGNTFGIGHWQIIPTAPVNQLGHSEGAGPASLRLDGEEGLKLIVDKAGFQIEDTADPVLKLVADRDGTPQEWVVKVDDDTGEIRLSEETSDNGIGLAFDPTNRAYLDIGILLGAPVFPGASGDETPLTVRDQGGTTYPSAFVLQDPAGVDIAEIYSFNGDPTIEAATGTKLRIGLPGTGDVELEIQETGKTRLTRQGTTVLELEDGGGVHMPNLPTSDPLNAGELWNDAGTLKVSSG